ncbi:cellulose binding domain-containing protein [Sorangium sp. So ce315]|uniref:cellulose binding domain-containing protein n=1 Tax=Sorangium sp. So ce315 TaxID=3133299 RepID=UPI003F5F761B
MALSAASLLLLAACAEGHHLDENTGGGSVSSSSAVGVTSSSSVGVTSSSSVGVTSSSSSSTSSAVSTTSSSSGVGGDAASSSAGVGGEGGAGGIGAGGAGGDGGAGVTSTTAGTSVSSTTSTSVSTSASTSASTSVSSTTSSATGGGGSVTSTATSASSGGGPTGELEVQYAVRETAASTQNLSFKVNVRNTGDEPIALSDVTIRYWFTVDGASSAFEGKCDFTEIAGGCRSISSSFDTASGTEADRYLELGFSSTAGNLAPGATSGEMQIRIHSERYEQMMQTNDHSFGATLTAWTPWENMTAYRDGVLAWGVEP